MIYSPFIRSSTKCNLAFVIADNITIIVCVIVVAYVVVVIDVVRFVRI